jgi:peptidoglycan-N-acetylglucosamine deacetylase
MPEYRPFRILATLLMAGSIPGCQQLEPEDSHVREAWNQSYADQTSGKADSVACSGITVADQGDFQGQVILTFDDGPNPNTTPEILRLLREHRNSVDEAAPIEATFFVLGKRLHGEQAESMITDMVADGHLVGNHTNEHFDLRRLSTTRARAEVDNVTNRLAELELPGNYLRFPFGSAGCSKVALVQSMDYRVAGWHVDSADWCFASSKGGVGHCDRRTFKYVDETYRDDMVGLILSQLKLHNGGILLMHDVHENTKDTLPDILRALDDAGYSYTNLNDRIALPKLNGQLERQWVGSLCGPEQSCYFEHGGEASYCMPVNVDTQAGFCSLACEGYCPDLAGMAPTFCVALDDGQSGACIPQSVEKNTFCEDLPGTQTTLAERYVGDSNAPAKSSEVCLP